MFLQIIRLFYVKFYDVNSHINKTLLSIHQNNEIVFGIAQYIFVYMCVIHLPVHVIPLALMKFSLILS